MSGRRKKEEGRRKKEEGRRKKEEGRRKKEGRRKDVIIAIVSGINNVLNRASTAQRVAYP
ncbi:MULTISPECIES: hypothetical protein [unclassified Microcoleus]|uniref:hypothetical protein n=1 Tax=unclassified Microcoleus TaxID=2642155 RepID=UPI002FD66650